jgi:hypothetical protein
LRKCCFSKNSRCSNKNDCCGDTTCQDGTCKDCLQQNASCSDDTWCCQIGVLPSACRPTIGGGLQQTCQIVAFVNQVCSENSDCYSGLQCGSNGKCCISAGNSCFGSGCCEGTTCSTSLYYGTLCFIDSGQPCQIAWHCRSGSCLDGVCQ